MLSEDLRRWSLCDYSTTRLLFGTKHRTPWGEELGGLALELLSTWREILLIDYKAEGVCVKPLVRHDQMSLMSRGGAPAVLDHPLGRLA